MADLPGVALVLRSAWAGKVLRGTKTLELRGSTTKKRCTVAVAVSGTQPLAGQVRITDSFLMAVRNPQTGRYDDVPPYSLRGMKDVHQVEDPDKLLPYDKVWGWKLENPVIYKEPRPYEHTKGCVGWVRLPGSPDAKKAPPKASKKTKRPRNGRK